MRKEDLQLVIDFMHSRRPDFERHMRDRGLSSHAAVFIIEDLERTLEGVDHEQA